jgi:ABC-type Mn2+/Zn2+ transport system permease subunit
LAELTLEAVAVGQRTGQALTHATFPGAVIGILLGKDVVRL